MISRDEAKAFLNSLASRPKFEKMIQTAAIISEIASEYGLKPIIVGGLAVEIYTRNEYTTSDIDLVFARRDIIDRILTDLGFEKESRYWYHPEIHVAVEVPGDMLENADEEKITQIRLDPNRSIYVIGIEDIILDRLRACIHWRSESDCEWGYRLFYTHFEELDIPYMKTAARNDLVSDRLDEWLRTIREKE